MTASRMLPEPGVTALGDLDLDLARLEASVREEEHELVPLVHRIQETYGFLPRHALEWAARRAGTSLAHAFGVATFYTGLYVAPRGRDVIRVCLGTACHVAGAERLTDHLARHLGVAVGETTADLAFTLEGVACVGCCSLAPVVAIGEATHGRVEPTAAVELVREVAAARAREEATS